MLHKIFTVAQKSLHYKKLALFGMQQNNSSEISTTSVFYLAGQICFLLILLCFLSAQAQVVSRYYLLLNTVQIILCVRLTLLIPPLVIKYEGFIGNFIIEHLFKNVCKNYLSQSLQTVAWPISGPR